MNKFLLVVAVVSGFLACSKSQVPGSRPEPRKTVSAGTLSLVATDLGALEPQLLGELDAVGGFIAGSELSGTPGGSRFASFTLRIPSARFREAIHRLSGLGSVTGLSTDARDVTAEYTDTEARISAKQTEETRLLHLLETGSGSLADVLAIEKELSRVRTEVEELIGRSKLLTSQASMATLTVSVTEQPEPLAGAFSGQLRDTLRGSLGALAATARVLAIAIVALAPWALVLGLIAVPGARRRRRGA